ncbi:MAG: cation:proton antiporter [Bacteroidales bacterium]|nr:cation:proton antiporter [Bacteroidales bacterium]
MHEPLAIFTALIATIFFAPFLFRFLRLPNVASFILAGMLIGPYGFNVLARDASIELLGVMGLLYIMFMAGLELDPDKLKASKKNSIVFGLLTFFFPFIIGYIVSVYLLKLELFAALLVSIMFSTHTLVAYPIVRKLGINANMAVLTAVGGTIITDTLVLMILSIVSQSFSGGAIGLVILKLSVFFALYMIAVITLYPRLARWFFKNIKRDRPVHYLFLLLMVCVSAMVAELIGSEAIIGAFAAGLALSRAIPKKSLLMHHIEFAGNILFIPVFLISIGMLINTRILLQGTYIWYISAVLIFAALAGKWLAAMAAQKVLKFNFVQGQLLFGLTSSHAAATIAVILIGFEKHIIDENIFNATVLIIMASSLVASFFTEKYGKKMAVGLHAAKDSEPLERIMVPVSNPHSMESLVNLAYAFRQPHAGEPVYLLSIVNDDDTQDNLLKVRETLEENVSEFNHLVEGIKVVTRVDLSISSGIIRTAKEHAITDIVFGWGGRNSPTQKVFGQYIRPPAKKHPNPLCLLFKPCPHSNTNHKRSVAPKNRARGIFFFHRAAPCIYAGASGGTD